MKFYPLFFLLVCLLAINPFPLLAQYDTITVKYPNGRVESVVTYYKNYKEGPAKFFSDQGILLEERSYKDGLVNGLVKTYYPNGNLREVFNVSEGRREGPATLYDTTGQIISERFFSQGRISEPGAPAEEFEDEEIILPPGVEENPIAEIQEDTTAIAVVVTADIPSETIETPVRKEPEIIDENYFYAKTDIAAIPKEGWDSLFAKIITPQRARDKGIGGIVEVKTKIDKYGDVIETKVTKGIGHGCDDAAEIAITYTKFLPAYKNGAKVNSELIIPVTFKAEKKAGFFDFLK